MVMKQMFAMIKGIFQHSEWFWWKICAGNQRHVSLLCSDDDKRGWHSWGRQPTGWPFSPLFRIESCDVPGSGNSKSWAGWGGEQMRRGESEGRTLRHQLLSAYQQRKGACQPGCCQLFLSILPPFLFGGYQLFQTLNCHATFSFTCDLNFIPRPFSFLFHRDLCFFHSAIRHLHCSLIAFRNKGKYFVWLSICWKILYQQGH